MKRLLLPLLAALALPTAVNAQNTYKMLFNEDDGVDRIIVDKIYDEWNETTSCRIYFTGGILGLKSPNRLIDRSNYELEFHGYHINNGEYKFDNGWINKLIKGEVEYGRTKDKITIPYSKWSKHKKLLINRDGNYTSIDLKVVNRARKHHEACINGGPSWLY